MSDDITGGLEPAYTYAATIVRWVDGDTVDLIVDLGFRMSCKDRFRLYGIDTPERGKPGYHEATAFMEEHAPAGTEVVVKTYAETEKYGRWLCEVYIGDLRLNAAVVEAKHAKPYFGGTKTV